MFWEKNQSNFLKILFAALQRPGRFDQLVYIGPPTGVKERSRILKALTRKFQFADDFDTEVIADKVPRNMALTGADFYALTVDAMMIAVERQVQAQITDQLQLCTEDFCQALLALKPSVSGEEMAYYQQVRNKVSKS